MFTHRSKCIFTLENLEGMMEAFYWQRCEPSQSLYMQRLGRIHGGTDHQRNCPHRASLEENSHGVETYKFFQNWLRVPGLGPGGVLRTGNGPTPLWETAPPGPPKRPKGKSQCKLEQRENPYCKSGGSGPKPTETDKRPVFSPTTFSNGPTHPILTEKEKGKKEQT